MGIESEVGGLSKWFGPIPCRAGLQAIVRAQVTFKTKSFLTRTQLQIPSDHLHYYLTEAERTTKEYGAWGRDPGLQPAEGAKLSHFCRQEGNKNLAKEHKQGISIHHADCKI